MTTSNKIIQLVLIIIIVSFLSSCSEDAAPQGQVQLSMIVAYSGSQANAKPFGKSEAASADFNSFQNRSIASGAPSEFQIAVTEVLMKSTTGEVQQLFKDDKGKFLKITGNKIDMSDLFSNFQCIDNDNEVYELQNDESCDCGFDSENNPIGKVASSDGTLACATNNTSKVSAGKVASLSLNVGEYSELTISYKRMAKIKGCVTGVYNGDESTGPVNSITGTHTYCTQAGFSILHDIGGGQNIDFEDKTAELMDFDLAPPGLDEFYPNERYTISFPIKDNVTITEETDAKLTLLIDTNRTLRFFNQNVIGSTVGPGSPSDKSFFFASSFSSSQFIFVGQAGNIYGYQMETDVCAGTEGVEPPADYICTGNSTTTAIWLTIVTDTDENPILGSFMPDDDNLSWIKGGNFVRISDDRVAPDPSFFTLNEDGTYNLKYTLGSDGEGIVNNIDLRVPVGNLVPDVTFTGLLNTYGTIFMRRQL